MCLRCQGECSSKLPSFYSHFGSTACQRFLERALFLDRFTTAIQQLLIAGPAFAGPRRRPGRSRSSTSTRKTWQILPCFCKRRLCSHLRLAASTGGESRADAGSGGVARPDPHSDPWLTPKTFAHARLSNKGSVPAKLPSLDGDKTDADGRIACGLNDHECPFARASQSFKSYLGSSWLP